jgi:Co/Zn/Cd efflux system component
LGRNVSGEGEGVPSGLDRATEAIAADRSFRRAVLFACLANLAYFGVEFTVAQRIGSVSLFADSIDFLEDASINGLILLALGWSLLARARLGRVLAMILLIPGIATLWEAWEKFRLPMPPLPVPLSLTALGALAVNFSCAWLLARHRRRASSLARAAFLSARNDVLANAAIIVTAIVTAFWNSAWPDLVVGLGIAALNAGAAWEVWEAARTERA